MTQASPAISSATSFAPSPSRSQTTTCAPSAASRRATAAPIPLAPPVTIARFPARSDEDALVAMT